MKAILDEIDTSDVSDSELDELMNELRRGKPKSQEQEPSQDSYTSGEEIAPPTNLELSDSLEKLIEETEGMTQGSGKPSLQEPEQPYSLEDLDKLLEELQSGNY